MLANPGRTPPASLWHWLRLILLPLALGTLAACAQNFDAKVTRFQSQLPAPQGQSFAIIAEDPALAGGLEFSQYSRYVAAQLVKAGYTEVATPDQATMIVRFDYGVDKGRERIRTTMRSDPMFGPWYGWRPGWAGWGGWGGYGGPGYFRSGWGFGWYDPWFDNGLESYTVYTSGVSMKIDRKIDHVRLFEGQAEAVSTSNRLAYLVPNLVEAMFTGFPGNSGETVRISIAPEKQPVKPR